MHLMIDLETLSLANNAVVMQIGWATFDPKEMGGVIDSGAFSMNAKEQMEVKGRELSYSTFEWWMRQSDDARTKLVNRVSMDTMPEILDAFTAHFEWVNIEGVWANGILFDLAILVNLFDQYDRSVPWHYRSPRDFKTLRALRPNIQGPKPAIAHSAEHDAIAQAIQVQNIFYSLLNETGA